MTKPPSPRPLSVKVIAITSILLAILEVLGNTGLLTWWFDVCSHYVSFLGTEMVGWLRLAFHVVDVLLNLYIGLGLWRFSELARKVAIGYLSVLLLSVLFFFGIAFWIIEPWLNMPFWIRLLTIRRVSWFLCLVIGLALWFLIKHKSAFVKPAKSP